MKLESIIFGIAGACFGVIVGWVLGSQQALRSPAAARAGTEQTAQAPAARSSSAAPAIIDEDRVQTLRAVAERDAKNVEARVQLADLYYDGERYDLAIPWYEEALKLNANNVDVSTDLGVSYYQTNQPDKAIEQFERSLKVDPKHVKTLLNMGIVRAFGKQDLQGATEAWRRVVEIAPGTQEAEVARRALDSIAAAHQGLSGSTPSTGSGR